MDRELTLMAVHAHPDDEVFGTGGVFAHYAEQGVRTVLVTCTNGEQGDGPGGVKPGEPGHDEQDVSRRRLSELRDSVGHLGIDHVELLGHRDSGMDGWDTNHAPDAFANIPVEDAARRLAELMERYRPQVVITYDENGGYGHPDHIQAHRVTIAAAELCGVPDKLYETAMPRSQMLELFTRAKELGWDPGDDDFGGDEMPDDIGTPDELITASVDVSVYVDRKRKALQAHASQGDSAFLFGLPEEIQFRMLGREHFVRRTSRVPAPDTENDLFEGLR